VLKKCVDEFLCIKGGTEFGINGSCGDLVRVPICTLTLSLITMLSRVCYLSWCKGLSLEWENTCVSINSCSWLSSTDLANFFGCTCNLAKFTLCLFVLWKSILHVNCCCTVQCEDDTSDEKCNRATGERLIPSSIKHDSSKVLKQNKASLYIVKAWMEICWLLCITMAIGNVNFIVAMRNGISSV